MSSLTKKLVKEIGIESALLVSLKEKGFHPDVAQFIE